MSRSHDRQCDLSVQAQSEWVVDLYDAELDDLLGGHAQVRIESQRGAHRKLSGVWVRRLSYLSPDLARAPMQQPNDESAASVEKQKKPEENTEKVTAEKPPVIPAAPEASPYYDVPKIDAPLSPERVLSAIINVLTQRGVLVKSYLERSEVDALNARNLARWRDRAAQNPDAKEPKPKPEPLPPKHSEGDWWDEQVLLEGWTPRMISMLHSALDPTKIHQDTLLWWKQCVDEKTGKQAFRYCFVAPPPLSVSELRDKVHRMFVYAYEVERPAIGKKLSELLSRITRMERIVYYDAEGLLGEEQYQLEKEGDWDGEDQEKEHEEDSHEDPCCETDPIDANTQERRIILRQEARIRVLEEQCSQMDELSKQVMSLQGSLKQVAEKLDAAAAAKSATPAAAASSASAATHAANGKKKHVNLDPAQTRREILRKKLEAQKRVQAEQEALKKAEEESGGKKAGEIVDDLGGEVDKK